MMSFRFEWIDATGVREEVLGRTFARFEVWVGDTCVTRAFDRHVRTVVQGANVSLLPLALWAVDSWWTACFEATRRPEVASVRDARGPEERSWHRRHGWLSSREGFAVPELVLSRGDGGAVRVDWFRDPDGFDAMPLRFLESGSALVPRDIVQHELGRLVDGVLARCEGIESPIVSALRSRRELISSATEDERKGCERAARLGLDAYDGEEVDDALADLLARSEVTEPVLDDLLDVADDISVSKLEQQIESLSALLEEARERRAPAGKLALSGVRARTTGVRGRPYERGHERARMIRREVLGVGEDVVGEALDRAIEATLLPAADVKQLLDPFAFHGIYALATAPGDVPFVATRLRHPRGQRFDRARALDALVSSDAPRLVTASFDPDQQASRAFAAELLAPAGYLRRRLKSRFVDQDDVERLAEELRVGALVVQHQVENHRLGELVDM